MKFPLRRRSCPSALDDRDAWLAWLERFGSVRAFAAALERADADAEWSAGSGWTFREVDPDA